MYNRGVWTRTAIYAILHFLVDFSCSFFIMLFISEAPRLQLYLLLYNFCAFAMQMPMGIVADNWNKNVWFAAIGILLILCAYSLRSIYLPAVILLGLGNGAFHVGGGIDVLNASEDKASALGVFVSPGAIGLYLGTLAGKSGRVQPGVVAAILMVGICVLIWAANGKRKNDFPQNEDFSINGVGLNGIWTALGAMVLVVCLRSYIGLGLTLPWKSTGAWGLLLVFAVAGGKAAGGFLADRFGVGVISLASQMVASVLLLFADMPVMGTIAMFLFNMSMPITLYAMGKLMPRAKGFSFGLLTFALFLGYLPAYFDHILPVSLRGIAALLSVVSCVLLAYGLKKGEPMEGIVTALLYSLLTTLVVEAGVYGLFGYRKKSDFLLLLLVNVLTNPLVVLLYWLSYFYTGWNMFVVLAALELMALMAEALYYKKYSEVIRNPWLFSIVANGVSFGLGLVIQWIL